MKITLVSPPTPNPSPSYFGPPYGLSLLGALLERQGHRVVAHDWDRHSSADMLADVPRLLREEQPDLVGVSVISVNRGPALAFIRALEEQAPGVRVIAGGAFPTSDPAWMLERAPLDYVCVGDGEETLLELVEALERDGDVAQVPGLVFRRDGSLITTPPRPPFEALDTLPHPNFELFGAAAELARHVDDDFGRALRGVRMGSRRPYRAMAALMVLTSRGCVYRCSFCPMSKGDHRLRAHSVTYAIDFMAQLKERYGLRDIVVGDNLFSWPRERALDFCRQLIDRKLDLSWVCMTRADMVDDELLELMAAAGCREVSYGIESFDRDVQRAMKKNLELDRVPDAFAATHQAGISSTLMLMVGNERESRASLRASVARARQIHPDRVLIKTTQVFPGTALWDKALAAGMFDEEYLATEDASTRDYVAEVGPEELRRLERMLELRTSYVDLPRRGVSSDEAKRLLLLAAFRGDDATLGPAEAIMRPDFPELLRYAEDHRLKRLWLLTDAAALAAGSTRRVLADLLHGVIVPFHSMNDLRHDEIVGAAGCLGRTRKGLLAWTQQGGKARAWAYLDRFNVGEAARWVGWLADHGVSEILFVVGSDPPGWHTSAVADLPSLGELRGALDHASAEARGRDLVISLSGLPECLTGIDPLALQDLWRPFDELLQAERDPEPLAPRRIADKRFGAVCGGCRRAAECEGVWARWLARDGEAALSALDADRVETS